MGGMLASGCASALGLPKSEVEPHVQQITDSPKAVGSILAILNTNPANGSFIVRSMICESSRLPSNKIVMEWVVWHLVPLLVGLKEARGLLGFVGRLVGRRLQSHELEERLSQPETFGHLAASFEDCPMLLGAMISATDPKEVMGHRDFRDWLHKASKNQHLVDLVVYFTIGKLQELDVQKEIKKLGEMFRFRL
eukprot:NODE_3654_length_748_cov_53.198856_g3068_i0.p2 GENE.NODE_3654_length_748_cov_53.198856_g3068_i0~~NODE_3654_length_748_cov_53.198856_g3068_i0.p2  ORF type:complete len:204 (+),score=49.24 NODE_3654_length_748_cov_53.198856_g3068_i0:32-613(+)